MTDSSAWNSAMLCPTYSSRLYPSNSSSARFARRIVPSGPTQWSGMAPFSNVSSSSCSRRCACSSAIRNLSSSSACGTSGSDGRTSSELASAHMGRDASIWDAYGAGVCGVVNAAAATPEAR